MVQQKIWPGRVLIVYSDGAAQGEVDARVGVVAGRHEEGRLHPRADAHPVAWLNLLDGDFAFFAVFKQPGGWRRQV